MVNFCQNARIKNEKGILSNSLKITNLKKGVILKNNHIEIVAARPQMRTHIVTEEPLQTHINSWL
jgi:hypothetical protein